MKKPIIIIAGIIIGIGILSGYYFLNTKEQINPMSKMYNYQAQLQGKIVEKEIQKKDLTRQVEVLNSEIQVLANEHNKTFQVIQEYKRQLIEK